MRGSNRLVGLLASAAMAALVTVAGPGDAAQADGYRFWSFWQATGGDWKYATTGPTSQQPKDGDVDGWRFTASPEGNAAKPRSEPSFDRICAGVRIKDGYKRVGLVLDYGTAADAPGDIAPPRKRPATSCVVADEDATSMDVLNKSERTRSGSNGLLCAIAGYPAQGCAESTSKDDDSAAATSRTAEPSATDSGGGSGSSTWFAVLAGLAIGAVLVTAMYLRRRAGRHPD